MFESLKTKYLILKGKIPFLKHTIGVYYLFDKKTNSEKIYGVLLTHTPKGIEVINQFELNHIREILSVIQFEKEKIPISICFSGKGLLEKIIENTKQKISDVFPGIDEQNAYTQFSIVSNNRHLISIIKKSTINTYLEQFEKLGLVVIDLHLGESVIIDVAAILQSNLIQLPLKKISIKNGLVDKYDSIDSSFDSKNYTFGNETVKHTHLPAIAIALKLFIGNRSFSNYIPIIALNRQSFIGRQKRKAFFIYSLALLFLLALGNFILFQTLYLSNLNLKGDAIELNYKINLLDSLQKKTKDRENLFGSIHSSTGNVSYYIDRIFTSKPRNIQIESIDVFPTNKNLAQQDSLSFLKKAIKIKGYCNQSILLNEFINKLQKYNWIKSSKIDFIKKDENSEKCFFQIETYLK